MTTNALAKLDKATTMLAEAKTLEDVKSIMDIAEAARAYARAAKLGLEAYNHAAEVKVRAERKAGDMLRQLERSNGGQPTHSNMERVEKSEYREVLDENSIPNTTAHRWQLLADMPDEVFEKHVEETRGEKPITTSGIVQELNAEKKKQKRAELMRLADKHEAKAYDDFSVNDVYVADIHTLTLPESSADMIFTDPPYLEKDVPLFGELARFASNVLKPGAYLMTYSGKMFLPSVMSLLGEHLEYVWMYGIFQPDSNHKIQKHHIFQTWRPIVCYKKPGKSVNVNWQPDMIKATRDKTFHEWQQQIEPALKWIDAYTLPNDLVVDPFVGGGTTLAACKQLRRNYIGFDIDPEAVKVSKIRLENV